jgi:hypothetical protein
MRNRNFSSEGQRNSDILINLLKLRLHDNGKAKSTDGLGNTTYVDVPIYEKDVLEGFLDLAVSEFNSVPDFTDFTLENSRFVDCFAEVIVEGAALYALSSKALIERGREFQLVDNGLQMQPPAVAEMLNTQFSILLTHHWNKLVHIKLHIKSFTK